MDRGQQVDEGMANGLPSIICWMSVNQPYVPQRNQRLVGKVIAIEIRPRTKTALYCNSPKSPNDGEVNHRRLTLSNTLVMPSVPREES